MRYGVAVVMMGAGLALAGCETMKPAGTALVATPLNCTPKRFEIYFADSEAGLTLPAKQAIDLTANQLEGCDIRTVQVLGLADARGGTNANLSLSERRAKAVAEALRGKGWPEPAFDVTAGGDAGAEAADGVREPMRRRTEVLVDAQPR